MVVVEGKDILQPVLSGKAGHRSGGGAGAVKRFRDLLSAAIQYRIVMGLVDPHTPDDHARMVAVPAHHLAHIPHHQILPGIVTEILPAGRFFPYHETELVAGIEEGLRLRVMRTTHHIAMQFAAKDFSIAAQDTGRHSTPDIRIEFMAIETEQFEPAAVQEKAVDFKARITESNPGAVLMQQLLC